ncbi:MAG: thioredoxin domain-containing protein [Dehalococcoidia bacterium]|nr:thioredoxin domain-containing protein [Dehalococcoidia bacterium]
MGDLASRLAEMLSARTVALVVVALAVGFAGGVGYALALLDRTSVAEPRSPQVAAPEEETPSEPFVALDIDLTGRPFLGEPDAPVIVIEMTDYECPFCRRHRQQVLGDLIAEYGGRIRYFSLHFPLTLIHPLAFGASEAAECAHDQGRFWEYNEAMFDSTARLVPETLTALAGDVGMDVAVFSQCLTSGSKRDVVVGDIQVGQRLGVRGTPTFFINGKLLSGARPLDIFRQAIDAELAEVGG